MFNFFNKFNFNLIKIFLIINFKIFLHDYSNYVKTFVYYTKTFYKIL